MLGMGLGLAEMKPPVNPIEDERRRRDRERHVPPGERLAKRPQWTMHAQEVNGRAGQEQEEDRGRDVPMQEDGDEPESRVGVLDQQHPLASLTRLLAPQVLAL